jgi:hypothetical protein
MDRVPKPNISEEHVGFVVDRVALVLVFKEYFGFPCHLSHQEIIKYRQNYYEHILTIPTDQIPRKLIEYDLAGRSRERGRPMEKRFWAQFD